MKKSEWSEMRVSGFLGWLHRLVMLITFPFRKFWQIVIALTLILAILIAIPLYKGIKLRDVWDWYMVKMPTHEFVAAKDKATAKVNSKIDSIKKTVNQIVPEINSEKVAQTADGDEVELVTWNVAAFKKAQYTPQGNEQAENTKPAANNAPTIKVEVAETAAVLEAEQPQIPEKEPEPRNIYYEGPLTEYYTLTDNKDLEYLQKPEELDGNVEVVGPNSLYIQDKFVFLYGIYSDAEIYDVVAAQKFLLQITEGKNVHCDIIAYTVQTRAGTALCFVDETLINKALVDNNLARNVALK